MNTKIKMEDEQPLYIVIGQTTYWDGRLRVGLYGYDGEFNKNLSSAYDFAKSLPSQKMEDGQKSLNRGWAVDANKLPGWWEVAQYADSNERYNVSVLDFWSTGSGKKDMYWHANHDRFYIMEELRTWCKDNCKNTSREKSSIDLCPECENSFCKLLNDAYMCNCAEELLCCAKTRAL